MLPGWMRKDVDMLGRNSLHELRLRTSQQPELVLSDGCRWLSRAVVPDDLHYVINVASQYSPWAASTAAEGYITAPGGHRVGICGDGVMDGGTMRGIRNPTSLCIRVARDFPDIGRSTLCYTGSLLIIGRPGSGKTTLLRDIIRQRSDMRPGSIAVVDERGELFPVAKDKACFDPGIRTDVLRLCGKEQGILNVLKTMGPSCIAVDEITEEGDCKALLQAGWCGVSLLATAHAADRNDLFRRPVYRSLIDCRLFDTLLIMQPDKSFKAERMTL